ncbi:hypothetical protein SARC_05189, partial [Sphaeroforma arctica JP610]
FPLGNHIGIRISNRCHPCTFECHPCMFEGIPTPQQVEKISYAYHTKFDIFDAMGSLESWSEPCVICNRAAQLVCPCLKRHFCSTDCQKIDWIEFNHHALCHYDPATGHGVTKHSSLPGSISDSERPHFSRRNDSATHRTRHDVEGILAQKRYSHVAHPYTSAKRVLPECREERVLPECREVQPGVLDLGISTKSGNPGFHSENFVRTSADMSSRYSAHGEHRSQSLASSHSQGSQPGRADGRNYHPSITPQLSFNSHASSAPAHRHITSARYEHQSGRDAMYLPEFHNKPSDSDRTTRTGSNDSTMVRSPTNDAHNRRSVGNTPSNSNEKPFVCPWVSCKKEFSQANNLKRHIRVHTGEKPYVCTWNGCGKKFGESSNLKRHLRLHSGEKPYLCDWEGCDMSFADASYLKSHQRVHVTNGVFPCTWEGCVKTFSAPAYLKRHIRVHTNEQPYACTYCEKRFNQASNLSRHVRRHTSQRNGS